MHMSACNGEGYDEKSLYFNVEVDILYVKEKIVTISQINNYATHSRLYTFHLAPFQNAFL